MKWRFVCGKDPLSRLIAWWGNGWRGFSHVDAIIRDGAFNKTVYEGGLLGARSDRKGGSSGVQKRPMDYLKGTQIRISVLDLVIDLAREDEMQRWLLRQINRKYDMNNIADLILGRQIPTSGRWICSALQDEACVKFGVYREAGVPAQQITPDTLHALLCSRGAVETYSYEGPPI